MKPRKVIFGTLRWTALSMYLLFAVFPLAWIFITSIKPPQEVYTYPIRYWPSKPTGEAYVYLFEFANFFRYFVNSIFVSMAASISATFIAMLSGYVLARMRFRGRYLLTLFLFFTQMIPAYLLMIPQFSMFSDFKLINRLSGIILIYIGLGATFSTIMARGFFVRIPETLEEAAMIDGCTRLGALFRITLRLMLPGVAAVFSFSFVNNWNELFTAALFLNSDSKMTVPVALYSFISKAGIQWNVLGAGIIIALVPTIFVFSFAQKYIVAGLTQGSVKE
ncbi:MAG TPA: carbohydrate ABC transporter permease [Thermotogota bacterium]|nr:carbohydrate ABC transporter permease [Thermotogota bacterium]HRW93326.1 carbohydrate ABC transporter permease [Thermotogota bacterium]HRW93349.1 carbohydrate ABC transporter permease [Thermotogota bacterium]